MCFSNVTSTGFRLDVIVFDEDEHSGEEPYRYGDTYEYTDVMGSFACDINLAYGSLGVWPDEGDGTSNFIIYDDFSFSTALGYDAGETGWLLIQ